MTELKKRESEQEVFASTMHYRAQSIGPQLDFWKKAYPSSVGGITV